MKAKADLLLPDVVDTRGQRMLGGPTGYPTGHDRAPHAPRERLYGALTYVGSVLRLRSYRLAAELAFADSTMEAAIAACRVDGLDDESLEARCTAGFELADYFEAIPLTMVEAVYRLAFGTQSPITVVDSIPLRACREAITAACVQLEI